MITFDRGTPRIAREITTAPLTVRVDGTVVPWDKHTAITIDRKAVAGQAANSVATAQLAITSDTLLDLPQRAWVTCELTAAAATAISAPTASRYRFAGRLTDVDLGKPRPTAPARYDLTAAGTLASMRETADPYYVTSWDGIIPSAPNPIMGRIFPPTAYWPTVGFARDYSGTQAAHPGDVSAVYPNGVSLRDALATIVNSHPGGLLAENRDGSIRFTTAGHSTVATVPANATGLAFPRRWPTNDVTVTYGPATTATEFARQLAPNPNADTSTAGYAASGGTLSWSAKYVQLTQTDAGAAFALTDAHAAYDATRDGKIRVAWWLQTAPGSSGKTATVSAHFYNGGTFLSSTTVATLAGTASWTDYTGAAVVTPPTNTTVVRLRVDVPAGWVTAGQPALRFLRASLVTVGHGTFTDADFDFFNDGYDFDGDTADGGGYVYAWTGTTDNSVSTKTADPGTARTVTVRDATSITAHGSNPDTLTALISAGAPSTAAALASTLLDPGGWEPPPITLDILGLLEAGQDATARALLALELGARISVPALPADTPQDLVSTTACYVAGIRETIAPGSWRITITPALIP